MASSARLTHNNKRQPHLLRLHFYQSAGSTGRPTHRRPLALRQPRSCGGPWHLTGAPLHSPELPVGRQEFSRLTPTELTPNTTPWDKGGSHHHCWETASSHPGLATPAEFGSIQSRPLPPHMAELSDMAVNSHNPKQC